MEGLYAAKKATSLFRLKLAAALEDQFAHHGQRYDPEDQILLCQSLVDLSTPVSIRPQATCLLSLALRQHYEQSGDSGSIKQMVSCLREILEGEQLTQENLIACQAQLGSNLLFRYTHLEDADDLSASMSYLQGAVALSPRNHPQRDGILSDLGLCLLGRAGRYKEPELLDQARECFTQSLRLRPPGHRQRHMCFHGLGFAHYMAFHYYSKQSDLDASIDYHWKTLDLRPEGHPDRLKTLTNLAITIRMRHEVLGGVHDLTQAVELHHAALALYPESSPKRWKPLTNLSNILMSRARFHGDLTDLFESIKLSRKALRIMPTVHHGRWDHIQSLAAALMARFELLGSDDDSKEGVDLFRASYELCPPDHPKQATAIFGLLSALVSRYEMYGSTEDLLEASRLPSDWLDRAGSRTMNTYAMFAANTAKLHVYLWNMSGLPSDLDRAIELYSAAVNQTDTGDTLRPQYLLRLSRALRSRYQRTHQEADLIAAAEAQQQAGKNLDESHPDYVEGLFCLASQCLVADSAYFDAERALLLIEKTLINNTLTARTRLSHALEVLMQLQTLHDELRLPSHLGYALLDAYRCAIALLPKVAFLGLDMRSLLHVLERGEDLGTLAAGHALRLTLPEIAIEILEESRAVFWSQQLKLRTSFAGLPDRLRGDLEECSRSLELLHFGGSHPSPEGEGTANGSHHRLAREQELSARMDGLITEARSLFGLEHFLKPDVYATLLLAAARGPVVVLVAGLACSYAVILTEPNAPLQQVSLPTANSQWLVDRYQSLISTARASRGLCGNRGMRVAPTSSSKNKGQVVLEELWCSIVQPVVKSLGSKVSFNCYSWYVIVSRAAKHSLSKDASARGCGCAAPGHLCICRCMPQGFSRRIARIPPTRTTLCRTRPHSPTSSMRRRSPPCFSVRTLKSCSQQLLSHQTGHLFHVQIWSCQSCNQSFLPL